MRNTREDVVAAALGVLAAHGLEDCSMRRVAGELGLRPSALYHHVPNKQTLLALMADEVVAEIHVASEDPADLCRSLRRAMLSIRDGADLVATASAFRLGDSAFERRLAELVGDDGARTLALYTFAQAQATQMQEQAVRLGAEVEGTDLSGVTPGEAAAAFDRGLALILRGLGA